ncbi:hypothetical protein GGQ74_000742 [Desulfobaculum xiamenense]|uniref:Uncharacterized protein n=1 Tax=Desulfobaculum xiamenense TaxID=995050 RepID=A0A846QKX1_9BACT|nr:hypothetical protein [Desulfobaculum xiamenense]NJB67102.1 hypothetical protein [Desulfobaculum xiamenense]
MNRSPESPPFAPFPVKAFEPPATQGESPMRQTPQKTKTGFPGGATRRSRLLQNKEGCFGISNMRAKPDHGLHFSIYTLKYNVLHNSTFSGLAGFSAQTGQKT